MFVLPRELSSGSRDVRRTGVPPRFRIARHVALCCADSRMAASELNDAGDFAVVRPDRRKSPVSVAVQRRRRNPTVREVVRKAMTMRIAIALALLVESACVAGRHPHWTNRVPAAAQAAGNPYAGDAEAARAGAQLYAEYCASCHGRHAGGIGGEPGARS